MDITITNRGTRTSFKEFEKDLLKEGLIRLRPFYKKDLKNVNLETFIKKFLSEYNENHEIETVFADSLEQQCEPGLRRSGGDIFRLCKYYYPSCTLEEVLRIVNTLCLEEAKIGKGEQAYIKSCVCRKIKKRVFIAFEESINYQENEKDEFNRKLSDYDLQNVEQTDVENDEF